MSPRARTSLVLAVLAAGAMAPPSVSAQTRPEYAAQADAICQQQGREQLARLKRKRARESDQAPGRSADTRFLRHQGQRQVALARTIQGSLARLTSLPSPPGDELILSQWFDSLRTDALDSLAVARITRRRRVRIGRFFRASDIQFVHSRVTDLLVDGFGFRICGTPTYYSSGISAERVPQG